ncbi:DUF262 domain-containing protein [Acinetobacter baumannii]|uniref:DUF262 domain-containing protein n=2 Tax=Acinetobacter baumannii TaxID=470 RepID=UPI002341252A|nr:DUF262 domain-containing protein [Acinetobacter baumannii]MDC4585063.1 DUF262 domain-containing protein [Acinetobacter baumannii]MDC4973470.1 DUF262 domain-containing protein [Acinetobacter baumannii]MDK2130483.1 DUF262 domain-containing protein [Acinetobacter baumannii]MDK2161178.1 DUF262 domain-containing protein [Acinetobacter baumannii]MDK2168637.1 DUF262 domain-containing protein [Acinetobacter baumannii]
MSNLIKVDDKVKENQVTVAEEGNGIDQQRLIEFKEELDGARRYIKTQKLSMTIGELCSLYKRKDLILNPNFQRVFRWKTEQQSRLVESIFLGIPLPPIFVAQQADAKWIVIDGLQRLSTLFKLEGLIEKDENDSIQHVLSQKHQQLIEEIDEEEDFNGIEDELEEALKDVKDSNDDIFYFQGLKKLTKLNNLRWIDLPIEYRRLVRRGAFDINIIYLEENNTKSQYELFQRLNTGGSSLTPQEVRNCIIIMNNLNFFNAIDSYRMDKNFIKITNLSLRQMQEAYDMELINRFIISLNYENINFSKYNSDIKISDFIDNETLEILDSNPFKIESAIDLLKNAIDLLEKNLGHNSFKKYNPVTNKFYGSFNLSAYEAILIGVAKNLNNLKTLSKDEFIEKIKNIYSDQDYINASSRGTKVIDRFEKLIKFSEEYFSK